MGERDSCGTAYELNGPKGAPVVVLIHGLGLNRHVWRWHVPAFAQRYRVLSYDFLGHGESAPVSAPLSLAALSEQLRALMDDLGIARAAIAGFSLGGMINRRFALDHPDRVRALLILNSPHERGPEAQKMVEERAARTAEGGPEATFDNDIKRWFTSDFRETRPNVIALVRKWIMANDPDTVSQARQVLARGVIELIRPDPPITAPTLVMTCENETGSTPEMARAIASEISGARTVIVPELQHIGLIERPELFTEPMLRFLDDVIR